MGIKKYSDRIDVIRESILRKKKDITLILYTLGFITALGFQIPAVYDVLYKLPKAVDEYKNLRKLSNEFKKDAKAMKYFRAYCDFYYKRYIIDYNFSYDDIKTIRRLSEELLIPPSNVLGLLYNNKLPDFDWIELRKKDPTRANDLANIYNLRAKILLLPNALLEKINADIEYGFDINWIDKDIREYFIKAKRIRNKIENEYDRTLMGELLVRNKVRENKVRVSERETNKRVIEAKARNLKTKNRRFA